MAAVAGLPGERTDQDEASGASPQRRSPSPHPSVRSGDSPPGGEREPEGPALLRRARKLVVLIVGGTVVAIGIVMLVLPGPAFVVIPAGIAILATEFAWARRLLRQVKVRIRLAARKARQGSGPTAPRADI